MDLKLLDVNLMKAILFISVFINLGFTTTFIPSNDISSGESLEDDSLNYDTNESAQTLYKTVVDRGPHFDFSGSKNITALVGKTAYMSCRVKNIGNKTVSWIRHRDIHLLTVGRFTYTSDQRFECMHDVEAEEWSLKLRYPQQRDTGFYECQISTTPPVGQIIYLSIVEPITTIIGGLDLYINTGSTINLTCIVKNLPEPPPSIIWTHNTLEINYDSPRGGVSVITEKGDITTSYLLIQRAKNGDSGKYVCSPSYANPKSINVHILNGEHPEAMHGGGVSNNIPHYGFCFINGINAILLIIACRR